MSRIIRTIAESDEYPWDNILRANFCPKVTFGLWPFLWSNLAIFDFDGHFHPSNGRHTCHNSASQFALYMQEIHFSWYQQCQRGDPVTIDINHCLAYLHFSLSVFLQFNSNSKTKYPLSMMCIGSPALLLPSSLSRNQYSIRQGLFGQL